MQALEPRVRRFSIGGHYPCIYTLGGINQITMPVRYIILSILLLFPVLQVTAADKDKVESWRGLQKMMSSEEFKASGLDKLTEAELRQLDEWVIRFLAYDAETVVNRDTTIQAMQKTPVLRRIPGHFTGWSGKTVFRLDNGEVWRQRFDDRYRTSLDDPEVEIVRNLLGYYELRVVKTGRRIGVTRVE